MTGTEYLRFRAWTIDLQCSEEYIPLRGLKDPLYRFDLTSLKGFLVEYFTVLTLVLPKLDFKNKKYDMVMICRTEMRLSREDVEARKDGFELPVGRFLEAEGLTFYSLKKREWSVIKPWKIMLTRRMCRWSLLQMMQNGQ